MDYPTSITICDGKYTILIDLNTGQAECLRYGEKWRDLVGDKMVLAMFDRIVELESALRELVVLKDLHDRFDEMKKDVPDWATVLVVQGVQKEYLRRKPAAWQAARDALGG